MRGAGEFVESDGAAHGQNSGPTEGRGLLNSSWRHPWPAHPALVRQICVRRDRRRLRPARWLQSRYGLLSTKHEIRRIRRVPIGARVVWPQAETDVAIAERDTPHETTTR